jgi:hypothetical protein
MPAIGLTSDVRRYHIVEVQDSLKLRDRALMASQDEKEPDGHPRQVPLPLGLKYLVRPCFRRSRVG